MTGAADWLRHEIKTSNHKGIESFSLDNLRWDKVIICTDADVDGFHIRTMLLTMIYRLMPTLIEKGKVYIAESPLYEITITKTKRKDETFFAYTDSEKEEIMLKLEQEGLSKEKGEIDIKRSKGLGENQPEMMSLTTMHPSSDLNISLPFFPITLVSIGVFIDIFEQ